MGRITTRVRRARWHVDEGPIDRVDTIAVEEPLEMRLGETTIAATMRTPGDDFDLTLGHLLTEGLIDSTSAVAALMHCTDLGPDGAPTFNVVQGSLRSGTQLLRTPRARTESMTSACGVCGSESIAAVRTASRFDVGADTAIFAADVIASLPDALRRGQSGFERTGGMHAAALATPTGELSHVREDVGRHNAVDKVIGAAAREREVPLAGCALVVSARASFELVQKALVVGIPALIAVGAPTSLAVDLARDAGLTLIAFTRAPTFSVYAGEHRIVPAN